MSLIILGAGGDLTERLLLPGLASLLAVEDCEVELIGSGRNERTAGQWAELVDGAFGAGEPEHVRSRLVATTFVTGDATDPEVLRTLLAECSFTPVVYFALPPGVTTKACEALREVDLPAGTRLALEKPFGVDLESARKLNGLLRDLVPENQVLRIDHFLGKSMVLNIIGLRFANRIVEAVWDAEHIDRVEIVYDESLGLEGRGGYYDGAGALIDMIQSHLFQVLALVAMEPPRRVDEAELRSRVAQVLRALLVGDPDLVGARRRRRGVLAHRRARRRGVALGGGPARGVRRRLDWSARVGLGGLVP